jgi:hypothetical protein
MNVSPLGQNKVRVTNYVFLNVYLFSLGFAILTAQNYVGYEGFIFIRPGFFEIFIALTLNLLLLLVLPLKLDTIHSLISWFLTLTLCLPILALYMFDTGNLSEAKLQLVLITFLGLILIGFLTKSKNEGNPPNAIDRQSKPEPDSRFQFAVITLSVTAIALLVFAYGFSRIDVSLETLNLRRLSNRYSAGPFLGSAYIYAWISALLVPLNVLCWLKFRNLIFLICAGTILVMTFSITGAKSDVLTPLLSILFFYVYNSKRVYLSMILHHIFYLSTILIPSIIALWFSSPNLFLSTTRRFLLIPARLSTEYHNYVSEYGQTFFKQNRIGQFLFDERIPLSMLIGDRISPGDETNSNINALIDGYASLGFFGALLVAALMGITIRVLQNSTDYLNYSDLIGPLAATACTVWLNQSYFTSLLSSGVVLFLIAPFLKLTFERSRRKN